jgi:sulfite reductase alpha subunit-like flavoprotein
MQSFSLFHCFQIILLFQIILSFQFLIISNNLIISNSNHVAGDPPNNANKFYDWINSANAKEIFLQTILGFSVFALGSKVYQNFCQFGKNVDTKLGSFGIILPL